MKRVLTTQNAPEAHVALVALDSAGIEGVIRGEFAGALPVGPITRPSVWVRNEDYAEACRVLGVAEDASQQSETASGTPPIWIVLVIAAGFLVILWLQRQAVS